MKYGTCVNSSTGLDIKYGFFSYPDTKAIASTRDTYPERFQLNPL